MSPSQMDFRYPRRVVPAEPQVSFHVFGQVLCDDLINLQRRLVYEAGSQDQGLISVLLCEHEPVITMGRRGSLEHIHFSEQELTQREWEIMPVQRGGGCVLHGPGQLAVYIVAPIARLHWSVGNYLQRLQTGIVKSLQALRCEVHTRPQVCGVWGHSGLLVSYGIGVRHGIASFGVYVNVANELSDWQNIATMPGDCAPYMGSLLSENVAAGRIEIVRAALMEQLSLALASTKTSLHAGHSLLPVEPIIAREHAA